MPALLTSTSIGPSREATSAMALSTSASPVTSQRSASAAAPAAPSGFMSSAATVNPSSRSRPQVASPMPEAPPVTTATRGLRHHRFTGFCWPARSRHSWMKCSGLRNSSFSSAISSMVKPSGRRIR